VPEACVAAVPCFGRSFGNRSTRVAGLAVAGKTAIVTDSLCTSRPSDRVRDLVGLYLHLTPTSASWLNQVETWFSLLTRRQLRPAVHRSSAELEAALLAYATRSNETAKPFRWTKSADEILQGISGSVCALLTHDTSVVAARGRRGQSGRPQSFHTA
jgi:hypothetical protein